MTAASCARAAWPATASQGAQRWGVGSGASHLVSGHTAAHEALEARLAAFVGMDDALYFSTGYMANIGVMPALVGRGMTGLYASSGASANDRATATALLAPTGELMWLHNEALIDSLMAISGSGPATVAAIGALTIPAMIERGYDKYFSAALVAAAGCVGVMIPPSNPFVVYGVSSQVSIGDLFMSGIVPGIMTGFVLMGYC